MHLCRNITINLSIGVITIYNSVISIVDFIALVLSIALLTDGKTDIGDIAGVIILIFAAIALPCIICGICYIWSLLHIQNNLKMAKFFGFCNFIMMLFTLFFTRTRIIINIKNIYSARFKIIAYILYRLFKIRSCKVSYGIKYGNCRIKLTNFYGTHIAF